MFTKIVKFLGGDPNRKEVERLSEIVDQINSLENEYEDLSDEALKNKTAEFKERLASEKEDLDDILPEAFAAVREASKRTIGLRHYDVQMIGGIALHQKKIAEMRTGEGKTLVATLPLYLNALTGRGVHLVTVNDYLARRDARWMAPIYQALGLTVGVLQMAARTENGRLAFLVNLEKTSPHEDQHQLELVPRAEAYKADITYGTNSEFGFDYLRDNLTMRLEDRVQRGHYYAIVDEVDNILIDEARTPLIISGPASEDTEWYVKMAQIVRQLNPEDYDIEEKDRTVSLTEIGDLHVEQLLEMPLRDPERPEDITPEQARLMGYLEQALRAQFLYRRNKDYLVQAGKVIIVDEFTGRLMPGRRWSDGLHQAVEAKEGVKVEAENVTYATITLQNYFRMYEKLAGMTGTALTEAEEFYKIYKLDVLPIPTNLEYQALRPTTGLVEIETRDANNYKYSYYARRDDLQKKAVYWRRQDFPDVVYRTQEAKLRAITQEIIHYYVTGRPQLVGTTSVEHSERLSDRLTPEPIRRLLQVLLIREVWLEKHHMQESERAIPELAPLYKPLESLAPGDLRQMAKPLELTINLEDPANLAVLLRVLNLEEEDAPRLVSVLQGGIPHQVLNARKHDEESQIIARAGAFGAVTIATNMAGRGVDIKLGGELPEEILGDVIHILTHAGHEDAFDMNNEERRKALLSIDPAEYGIYEEAAKAFLEYMDNMERVRALGGLHVIGSERHEARRIDNQLRGRSARQGDPGSSRFYLALDDDLMRLFGGGQVEGLMERLNIDEALPIESGIVGRLVEQSQTRVEGSNFDVRKHLLEYDDVLNTQRERIYSQRDRVFTKQDLSEDVTGMLDTELQERIPKALQDDEGPWKLLAYLDEIQPAIEYEDVVFPSYPQRLLLELVNQKIEAAHDPGDLHNTTMDALLDLAEKTIDAEQEHFQRSAQELLENTADSLQVQVDERIDILDTYLDGLREQEQEEGEPPRRPQELIEELSVAIRMPVKLTNEQMRSLSTDPQAVAGPIKAQIKNTLTALTIQRIIGSFERRLEESLNVHASQLQEYEWGELSEYLLKLTGEVFQRRRERLLGSQGQIARDLEPQVNRLGSDASESDLIQLIGVMGRGAKMSFDRKTHRQTWQYTTRLRYSFLAARLLQDRPVQQVTDDVLDHLEEAQERMSLVWGKSEYLRMHQQGARLEHLAEPIQVELKETLGEIRFAGLTQVPLETIDKEDRRTIETALGKRVMNEIYRQLLLQVISELWVEYLTKVEALRVSIGLEAYAQRDPLVQYKSRAMEMFGELLRDIRSGVISRMLTYRPRIVTTVAAAPSGDGQSVPEPYPASASGEGQGPASTPPSGPSRAVAAPAANVQMPSGKKKRKRH
ncbi:MAG TPA: hypothetical protein VMT46_01330 [Anaerolineaceae bacterium]|nr:hypothetical protein [Anaerolineaceae bacterium]